ncbi:MAG: FHA domain-containing protein [Myxococcales bacterium]|nr:FHA domain-containing protein [Myxococcales bacterium]
MTTAPETLALRLGPDNARLVVLSGEDVGAIFPLSGTQVVIGRGDVEIPLRSDDVSRAHARLVRAGACCWMVEDLESRNGTFLNGLPVERAETLMPGDQIQVGSRALLAFVVHQDVERRVMRLQGMEAMGQLAGGIAHDFANMLAVLQGTIDYLGMQIEAPRFDRGGVLECIAEADEALERASALTYQLLDIARARGEPTAVDLAASARDTAKLCRRAIEAHIALRVELPQSLPVRGDANQLHQVVLNLIMNARDAIGARAGTITVGGSVSPPSTPNATPNVLLEVSDDGCGMDEATRQRVLEPFFTTKPTGRGTGLGLATVHSIVTRHGGTIDIDSRLGQGSTFRVMLPMSAVSEASGDYTAPHGDEALTATH